MDRDGRRGMTTKGTARPGEPQVGDIVRIKRGKREYISRLATVIAVYPRQVVLRFTDGEEALWSTAGVEVSG
jgi:hypothetical protein